VNHLNRCETSSTPAEAKLGSTAASDTSSVLVQQALSLLQTTKQELLTVNPLQKLSDGWGTCTGKGLPDLDIVQAGKAAAAAASGAIIGGVGSTLADGMNYKKGAENAANAAIGAATGGVGRVIAEGLTHKKAVENAAEGVVAGALGGVAGGIAGKAAESVGNKVVKGAVVVGGAAGAAAAKAANDLADQATMKAAEAAIRIGSAAAGSTTAEAIRLLLQKNNRPPVITKDLNDR